MHPDARRTVGRERIVKLRPIAQFIHRFDVIEKYPPDVFDWRIGSVNIDVLLRLTVSGAHSNHVALVGDDVIKFVLSKKAREGRIALAFLLASLDRNRDVIFALEPKANHDVGDRLACPINGDDVRGIELTQIVGAIFPARCEIRHP